MSEQTDPTPDDDTGVPDVTDGAQAATPAPEAATPAPEAATPAPEATGLPPVDAAVEQLSGLAERPVEEHVAVYDDVQRRLHDALAELDDEQ